MTTRILVVEDEPLIADDIQRTLTALGYDVPLTVATGREAVAAAGELRPGLVLMDIKLRGPMDGVEAASTINAQFEIPVVYLTSYSDDATLTRATQSHPFGYLVKPFNDRELKAAIEVALDKHELESRLAHRERWFSTTLQSIGDGVIATDLGETITLMNGVAEKLTGWKQEDAIGRKFDDVVRLVDSSGSRLESPVRAAFQNTQAVQLPASTDLLVKGGTSLSIDDTAAPIVDAKGNVLGGVMVFRDVTERRKLERELMQSERLTALGTIAAGMAHEINNPLSAVILNAGYGIELLQSALALLAEAKDKSNMSSATSQVLGALWTLQDTLEDVNKNAERVRSIIHNVRRIVRAERTYKTTLHLIDVLDAAAKMSWNTIRHHARLVKDYGTTPRVEANEGQLTQVFTNLLVNAAQAIGDGAAERNEIRLTTRTDSFGRAVVEVRDTGPGIPPHILPRIFDPFFTTKAVGVGMGLGLSICHGIIVSSGGDIAVESEVGKGTTFRITLPPTQQSARPAEESTQAQPRRGKVLIIDDDIEVGMSMERALRDSQDVTLAIDGRQALAKIGAGADYDVIFCDVMMPNMSGIDVYEALSVTHPELAKRITFMTGGALSERTQEFLDRTGNAFLPKPFTLDAARAVIQNRLK
jgi:two-component system cell cycle sensor histidine kinase/response regulator CckA